jgi:hypothetical protein
MSEVFKFLQVSNLSTVFFALASLTDALKFISRKV